MPDRTRTDLIIRLCLLIDLAMITGALLIAARTGRVLTGLLVTGTASGAGALTYLRSRGRH